MFSICYRVPKILVGLRGVVVNVLDYDIVVNEFEPTSRYYVNTLAKVRRTFIPHQLRLRYYYYFTVMALALNNP